MTLLEFMFGEAVGNSVAILLGLVIGNSAAKHLLAKQPPHVRFFTTVAAGVGGGMLSYSVYSIPDRSMELAEAVALITSMSALSVALLICGSYLKRLVRGARSSTPKT